MMMMMIVVRLRKEIGVVMVAFQNVMIKNHHHLNGAAHLYAFVLFMLNAAAAAALAHSHASLLGKLLKLQVALNSLKTLSFMMIADAVYKLLQKQLCHRNSQ